jgi:hypothetical protein
VPRIEVQSSATPSRRTLPSSNSIVLAMAVEEGWSAISQLVDFSALGIADAAPQALSSQNNELRTRVEKYHLVCLSRIVGAERISQAP